jgi:hypothetical protein
MKKTAIFILFIILYIIFSVTIRRTISELSLLAVFAFGFTFSVMTMLIFGAIINYNDKANIKSMLINGFILAVIAYSVSLGSNFLLGEIETEHLLNNQITINDESSIIEVEFFKPNASSGIFQIFIDCAIAFIGGLLAKKIKLGKGKNKVIKENAY